MCVFFKKSMETWGWYWWCPRPSWFPFWYSIINYTIYRRKTMVAVARSMNITVSGQWWLFKMSGNGCLARYTKYSVRRLSGRSSLRKMKYLWSNTYHTVQHQEDFWAQLWRENEEYCASSIRKFPFYGWLQVRVISRNFTRSTGIVTCLSRRMELMRRPQNTMLDTLAYASIATISERAIIRRSCDWTSGIGYVLFILA